MDFKVAVLGAGSWGTALAMLLAQKKYQVWLWARREEHAASIAATRENLNFLPGVIIPESIRITARLTEAVAGAAIIVLSVPSHGVREMASLLVPVIDRNAVVINTAKGLEPDTLMRLSQVIAQELPDGMEQQVATLSGPSHAEEVSRNIPTTVVVAARLRRVAELAQEVMMSPHFRVYTNPDVIGVELGGALKNIIALATGIIDGMGLGDNTRAALMTRGLAEIARLGMKMGAQPLTFAGLAGVGDLIVTCTSMHSRNRRAGILLGQGLSLEKTLAEVGMVVEGVRTTEAAYRLAKTYQVEMPITNEVYRVLFQGQDPSQGVANLMGRGKTQEVEEIVLDWENW
ncbi:MAG: NAD(P)H-dependent glycerol-3-phosphate dehydrogenase [Bacillota bacterium]